MARPSCPDPRDFHYERPLAATHQGKFAFKGERPTYVQEVRGISAGLADGHSYFGDDRFTCDFWVTSKEPRPVLANPGRMTVEQISLGRVSRFDIDENGFHPLPDVGAMVRIDFKPLKNGDKWLADCTRTEGSAQVTLGELRQAFGAQVIIDKAPPTLYQRVTEYLGRAGARAGTLLEKLHEGRDAKIVKASRTAAAEGQAVAAPVRSAD